MDKEEKVKDKYRPFLKLRDGIAFRDWHYYAPVHGTAIRFTRVKPGLIGFCFANGGLLIGLWKTIRLDLVCIHISRFKIN